MSGIAASCGGDDDADTAATQDDTEVAAIAAEYGVEIPEVSVDFGMMPYGDHMFYAAAAQHGWFEEVGIELGPSENATVGIEQAIPLILNDDFEVTTHWGPTVVQSMASAPNLSMFAFNDTHDGIYVLAPPNTEYETLSGLTEEGVPIEEAMPRVMSQFEGRKFAIDDVGTAREFVAALFELGQISRDDLDELLTVDDGRMLVLARGGQIDFAKPVGGAQTAELIQEGWYPVVGANEVIEGLPPGDPRGVSAVGNTGLMTSEEYYEQNQDTILRFVGVMYRTVDAIQEDIQNNTSDNAFELVQPVLQSAAGVELDIEGLRLMYSEIYSFHTFEEAAGVLSEEENPFYYENIYQPQIEAAQEGGVLPANEDFAPADVFGMAQEVYEELVRYKEEYERLLPEAEDLDGDAAVLADAAAEHYENRNYLDAARFLSAAVEGPDGGGAEGNGDN